MLSTAVLSGRVDGEFCSLHRLSVSRPCKHECLCMHPCICLVCICVGMSVSMSVSISVSMSVNMSDQVSMSVCACSHLDRDGDGYISVEEVGVLLEELGVDAGVGQEQEHRQSHGPDAGAALWAAQGTGQQLEGADAGAGQHLLAALANKQQSGVTFAEFLQFNSQVCLFIHSFIRSSHGCPPRVRYTLDRVAQLGITLCP